MTEPRPIVLPPQRGESAAERAARSLREQVLCRRCADSGACRVLPCPLHLEPPPAPRTGYEDTEWPPDAELVRRYRRRGMRALSEELGCTPGALRRRLAGIGALTGRAFGRRPVDWAAVDAAGRWERGETAEEIARAAGCSASAVGRRLRREGVWPWPEE